MPTICFVSTAASLAGSLMMALGNRFEHHTFAGAGHGFPRPLTIVFFRSTLGR